MATNSNGFNSLTMRIVGGLALAGILGTIGLATAQSGIKTQQETNTDEIRRLREAVESVPVMQKDIEHIKKDVSKIEKAITKLAEKED